MPILEPPHSHHVNAALGWLELGNFTEAEAELNTLSDEWRACPEVLFVRWEIQARRKDWNAALETATALVGAAPHKPEGWIQQSFSLHELKRTREAWARLLEVESQFPNVSTIPYNLACYACRLGDHTEAMRRLEDAIKVGGKTQIKALALRDADLEPLWGRVRAL